MDHQTLLRWIAVGTVAISLATTKGSALVRLNDGRDQLFVNASVSMGYNSNIFATKTGSGDILTTSSFGIEYIRKAGYIGVNANVMWNLGQFGSNTAQNFSNPTLNVEFSKATGRTTGSLTLNAARESRADSAAGLRTDSWNYGAGLNWKYPIIDRYSFSGGLNYGQVLYQNATPGIYNLNTYGASLDLFYAFTTERDLFAGYNIGFSDSGDGSNSTDHSFTVGVSGKIIPRLNGNVRAGYEIRQESTGQTFGSWTATVGVTWNVNRRFSINGTINKAFNTTSTGSSIDSLSANLDAQYSLTGKVSLHTGIGAGTSDFLSGLSVGRRDEFFTWSAGVNYNFSEHFKAALTYSYLKNWSNVGSSSYESNSITLNLSTRW